VLVWAARTPVVVVVVAMYLVDQPAMLKQRVRRNRQPEDCQQQRDHGLELAHERQM
jgi:hypothetical protein